MTARTNRRSGKASTRWDGAFLNVILQKEKSITWATLTREIGGVERATYEITI
jgi:hypothetical protein